MNINYQLAYNVNREVIGAGRQGGTSVNICDFIPVFENPKKSHLATLLFSKLRTFDFSRRKINILGAILYFFWLWHENSNIFYFWHENSNEVIFYISHHVLRYKVQMYVILIVQSQQTIFKVSLSHFSCTSM